MEYGNESISMLKGPDRVRKRPGVIFGSDGLDGCEQAFFEILSNSIDEAREGYGNRIIITRHKDHSITVQDFGRGIPIEKNKKENRYNWELVFCELYAGGKYQNDNNGNYEFSLGLNGLGTCSTQYASKFMDVVVIRDGYRYTLHFENGFNTLPMPGFDKERADGVQTGTTIHWLPDLAVFTEIEIPHNYFSDILKRQAIINPKIRFVFVDELENNKKEEYYYEMGIQEYVEQICGENCISSVQSVCSEQIGRDRKDSKDYKVKMHAVFCFVKKDPLLEFYHNSSWLEHGGAPDKAVRSAFLTVIDDQMRKNGKYTKTENKITIQDVLESLVFVSNCFSTQASYENQTKKAVKNKFICDMMTNVLTSYLEIYFTEHKAEGNKILDQILLNKRSREQAEKSKINIKKRLTAVNVVNRIQKFVDCRSRDAKKRELYIVEGDSALGSCKQGRDAEYQAIMPIRGKILNCLKADYDKIFKNDIIVDLFRVMGCGVELNVKGKKSSFNIKNLKFTKIIICTDADVDGYQIRTLVLAMLYRLAPTLIEQGCVYIAESPLYEISYQGQSFFAFSEEEKTKILKTLRGKKVQIQRSKGLGENDPEMMWDTTMNPETRRLIQITTQDAKKTDSVFQLLLGDDLAGRKAFITEHGKEYLKILDLD